MNDVIDIVQHCPVCGDPERCTLIDGWREVEATPIPIVGCGNPWHYTNVAKEAAGGDDQEAQAQDREAVLVGEAGDSPEGVR